jgi:hypothetical protein
MGAHAGHASLGSPLQTDAKTLKLWHSGTTAQAGCNKAASWAALSGVIDQDQAASRNIDLHEDCAIVSFMIWQAQLAHLPHSLATPNSRFRSLMRVAPFSTAWRIWRSVTALQRQTYMLHTPK